MDPGLRKTIYIPVDPGLTISSLVVINRDIYVDVTVTSDIQHNRDIPCLLLEHITTPPPPLCRGEELT